MNLFTFNTDPSIHQFHKRQIYLHIWENTQYWQNQNLNASSRYFHQQRLTAVSIMTFICDERNGNVQNSSVETEPLQRLSLRRLNPPLSLLNIWFLCGKSHMTGAGALDAASIFITTPSREWTALYKIHGTDPTSTKTEKLSASPKSCQKWYQIFMSSPMQRECCRD